MNQMQAENGSLGGRELSGEFPGAVEIRDFQKRFKGFLLDIPALSIPKGFATALIGENGAGKTTLLNALAGIRLNYKGQIRYFGEWQDEDRDREETGVRERIGYTGPGSYFLPHWTRRQVGELGGLLFEHFHPDRYERLCSELAIDGRDCEGRKVSELSDGNRMKLMLAAVFARDTDLLLLDEPASPLDPLMRDRLCEMLRAYLEEGDGERTVLFSTHNIADMENVTDYVAVIERGKVIERGFVEELKEKYCCVKGEAEHTEAARPHMYSISRSRYGFEGICLAENKKALAALPLAFETPTLSQICVALMRENTALGKSVPD